MMSYFNFADIPMTSRGRHKRSGDDNDGSGDGGSGGSGDGGGSGSGGEEPGEEEGGANWLVIGIFAALTVGTFVCMFLCFKDRIRSRLEGRANRTKPWPGQQEAADSAPVTVGSSNGE